MKKTIIILMLGLVGLGGCDLFSKKGGSGITTTEAYQESVTCSKDNFSQYVGMAHEALKKAQSVKHEWVHTAKILKTAESMAEGGDFAGACKEARIALIQGEMAHRQGLAQKNAGPNF